ncbi:hypothetical protein AK830_g9057 [Neonectria ditissima]|uniref:hydroxymethylglutaryl-CoA lyase n=1 Tax=Neonectria ditissima TaxID=78410 RepID=A0A0N8H5Z0_9HYPO|nr:hypothetical protein AK830_g9057 [Neonectria ditissima]
MRRPAVRLVEVGPRDGLQNIAKKVQTSDKIELIQRLASTGLNTLELTSVVSPKAVPQLADCRDVLQSSIVQQLLKNGSYRLPVLVPNVKGAKIAAECGVSEVAVFVSATEGFSRANINCTVEQSIGRAREVARVAQTHNMAVRGYVSCIFADPFDGPTPPEAVATATEALLATGCYEVSLGDTIGVGTPQDVRNLLKFLSDRGIPLNRLAGHFHDTYGQALANVWEAYNCGITVFDGSVAGLGGCPFAPGAKGNASTEDMAYMFERAGIDTGVDLAKLVDTGAWISAKLSQQSSSRAGTALASKTPREKTCTQHSPNLKRLEWGLTQETDELVVHRSGANLRVTMNRPRNGNALTVAMIEDLTRIFTEAGSDSSINRIVITGNGKFFCTGMDLGKGSTPVGSDNSSSADDQYHRLTSLLDAIDKCPKTTIACINGPAFGGGVGIAFTCDLRICTSSAKVTLSEAKLGLCPATISKFIIREWGVPFAREAMLTARPVLPSELKVRGIVMDTASDTEQLHVLLESLLLRLRTVSPEASSMCKKLVEAGWAYGGRQKQAVVMKGLFQTMMSPSSAGAFGVKEFQAGRQVDWDKYRGPKSVSKL